MKRFKSSVLVAATLVIVALVSYEPRIKAQGQTILDRIANLETAIWGGALIGGGAPALHGNTAVNGNLSVTGTAAFTGSTALSGGATVPTTKTISSADADSVLVGGKIVPQVLEINAKFDTAAVCVSEYVFTANAAYQVVSVSEVHGTAESTASSLSIQVEKDTGTTAAGSGTVLLTNNTNAGFNGKGTANTVQTGTLTATTGSLQMAVGDRLGIKFSAAATELKQVVVTVTLKRI